MNEIKRKCLLSNEIKNVTELVRIVKRNNGTFEVDSSSPGRGSYISKDIGDFERLTKQKLLNRSFKSVVPKEVYDQVIKYLREYNESKQTKK